MERKQKTGEISIFILLFGLALFIRFLNLGETPLSDYEAHWALKSWDTVFTNDNQVSSNPTYFYLTNSIFFLLGSSNFLARLWPALWGSMVIWVPFGFKRFLGHKVALIIALGLALDPGMVAVSRIAGGTMMALIFFLLTLLFFYLRKPIWAGIFGGMGLLSGYFFYIGLTGFLVAWGINRGLGNRIKWWESMKTDDQGINVVGQTKMVQKGLFSGFIAIILISTSFFGFPAGLSGWGSAIEMFFRGWVLPSRVPFAQPSLALVFYQPLAILFAIIGIIQGWVKGDKLQRWLSIWFLVTLLLTALYSQRMVFDSVWAIIPLWALASVTLTRFIKLPNTSKVAYGQANLFLVLGIIFWLVGSGPGIGDMTWLILLVIPALAVITTILIGLGWSWDSAKSGAIFGILLCLGIYTLSATIGATQKRQNSPLEFWYPQPGIGQADLFLETLGELALRETGRSDSIQTVVLSGSDSLRWLLRDIDDVSYISELRSGDLPFLIISPGDHPDLSQTMSYRGQDFIWYRESGWVGSLPQPLWSWVTGRTASESTESIVLWARSDLFPEGQEQIEDDQETVSPQDERQLEDGAPD